MEKIKALLHSPDFIPFVMMAGQHASMSIARIIEALIIAGIAGGIAVYGVTQTIEAKQSAFIKLYDRDHEETTEWRKYIQNEIDKNRDRIETLREKASLKKAGHYSPPNAPSIKYDVFFDQSTACAIQSFSTRHPFPCNLPATMTSPTMAYTRSLGPNPKGACKFDPCIY